VAADHEFHDEAPKVNSTSHPPLALFDIVCAVAVVALATLVAEGPSGFQSISHVLLCLAGIAGISLTLWWRNAYVVTRSIRWDGNLSLLWTSVIGVTVAMIVVSWLLQFEPARLFQVLVFAGWAISMSAVRFVFARRRDHVGTPVKVIVAGNTGDALATRLAYAERFAPMVRQLNVLGVDVALSTGLSNVALRRVSLGHVSGRPMVRVTPAPLSGWHLHAKRGLDVLGASALIVLTAPIMLVASLAIRIEDGGKAIFQQTRVGKGGFPFTIYKFRTMVNNAEKLQIDLTNDHEGPVFKMRGDPRITRVGSLLRKTSMDELPQLFNILRGQMSLVGPRPLPVHEVEAAPASFLDRHAVKPGLTGRWQVSGRSDTGFDELDELDRWYVDNWSLGQDFEILARTVPAVLLARGAR